MATVFPNQPGQDQRSRLWFKTCLNAAFRTSLACILVGLTTLYGPTTLRAQVAFPAFSYVTVILIITNATLGDALRGCWLAAYATVQGVCPAILCLWIIGPTRLTAVSTALVLGVTSFFIALPDWTHVISKRIALGQLVIVYVIGYINGGTTQPVMHPVHVAASTAVGVLACVLALLLPFPYLACSEVKQNCKMFAENASTRLKLYMKAYCAEDKQSSQPLISQAKSLSSTGNKILQCIKTKQESMKWERLPIKFLKPHCTNPGDRFQKLETLLRGMEMALTSSTSPTTSPPQPSVELNNELKVIEESISLHLKQIRTGFNGDSITVPESTSGPQHSNIKFLQTLQSPNNQNLPSLFFLFCLNLLYTESKTIQFASSTPKKPDLSKANQTGLFSKASDFIPLRKHKVIAALKCSLSLGLAVLFGLIYSKENGYWAGLPVAISLAAGREATFRVANVKAQGTVIGTVYGVLGCFVFERFVQVRFLALLPWFIFTSFLQRSEMYGQAGAVSAVIGAVLILGRKNFGPPSEFAIARIVETFIGLSCSIIVELALQPTRAASIAKSQLSKTLSSLHYCVETSMDLETRGSGGSRLKLDVSDLGKIVAEAEQEPSFWFTPFNSGCYRKLVDSLSKMADLLVFVDHAIGCVEEGLIEKVNGELEVFKKVIGNSVKCFEEISLVKSLSKLECSSDLEMGKVGKIPMGSDYDEEMEKVTSSFIERLGEVESENGEMVLRLSGLAFCMRGLVKETREVERSLKELVQWENPTQLVNLNEIYCKIHALDK